MNKIIAMLASGLAICGAKADDAYALVNDAQGYSYIQINQDLDSFSFVSDFKSIGGGGTIGFFLYPEGLEGQKLKDYIANYDQFDKEFGKSLTGGRVDLGALKAGDRVGFYENKNGHGIVRGWDFQTLAAATNGASTAFVLTDEEKAVEAALARGAALANCQSNELAAAAFASVTNLNAFSATPFLIQAQAKAGHPDLALSIALDYTARFPHPYILEQAAEWSALARRRDLVATCRDRALRVRGRTGISVAHYCDALLA